MGWSSKNVWASVLYKICSSKHQWVISVAQDANLSCKDTLSSRLLQFQYTQTAYCSGRFGRLEGIGRLSESRHWYWWCEPLRISMWSLTCTTCKEQTLHARWSQFVVSSTQVGNLLISFPLIFSACCGAFCNSVVITRKELWFKLCCSFWCLCALSGVYHG